MKKDIENQYEESHSRHKYLFPAFFLIFVSSLSFIHSRDQSRISYIKGNSAIIQSNANIHRYVKHLLGDMMNSTDFINPNRIISYDQSNGIEGVHYRINYLDD